jgi:HEAT repeat protein
VSVESPVDELWSALEREDASAIAACLAAIEQLPDKRPAVAALGEVLGCPFWTLRERASRILVLLGTGGLPRVAQLLRKGSVDQVYWACRILAAVERPPATTLMAVLASPSPDYRQFALQALGRRREPDAIIGLIQALDDPIWSLRQRAADALADRPDTDAVADALREAISTGNRNRVYWGVQVLCRILGPRSFPVMMKVLPWKDDDLRFVIVDALATMRVEGAPAVVVQYADDRCPAIRRTVTRLLVEAGADAVQPVVAQIQTSGAASRLALYRILSRIDPEQFLRCCQADLESCDPDREYVAIDALSSDPGARGIELLVNRFADSLWVVRELASETIAGLGEPALPALERALTFTDSDIRHWAIVTLVRIGSPAVTILTQALKSKDRDMRSFTMTVLKERHVPPELAPLLVGAFDDAHWPLRRQAADCVRSIGPPAAPSLLKGALSGNENVRFWSRRVLADLLGAEAGHLVTELDGLPAAMHDELAERLSSPGGLDELRHALLGERASGAGARD